MRVRSYGASGPRVLLLHGGGVGGWMWQPLRERMGDGYRFIVPDLPGHDASADETYRTHAQTVAELTRIVEDGSSEPLAVAGFSLGAQLAMLLAAERPDLVDRVAVVSAQVKPSRAPGAILALLGATAGLARQRWFAELQAKELFIPPELLDDYLRTSRTISRSTLLAAVGENIRFTLPSDWARFRGRALVLAGSRERGFMLDSARAVHAALPGSELEIVDGAGHGIPLQRPELLAGLLRALVDRAAA